MLAKEKQKMNDTYPINQTTRYFNFLVNITPHYQLQLQDG